MPLGRKVAAEFIGTFWLVFGGCGAAVLAAAFPNLGIGFVGVAFAFGLTVLTMALPSATSRLPFESRCLHRIGCRQALSRLRTAGIYRRPSARRGCRRGGSLRYRQRQGRLHARWRIRLKRVRRAFARRVLDGGVPRRGDRAHVHVPHDHSGRNRPPRAAGFRAHPDRSWAHSHSSHRNSRDQSFGESRAQHRPRALRGRMGHRTALALLVSSDHRRGDRRHCLSYGGGLA